MYQPNSTSAEPPKITLIQARKPQIAKLRVAAYARVSSDSEDQQNSYIAQVDYYTRHIASQESWELADIYADEGISGLVASKRDEFNRMEFSALVAKRSELEKNKQNTEQADERAEQLAAELEAVDTGITTFDEVTVRQLISAITVLSEEKLLIRFKDGTEIEQII